MIRPALACGNGTGRGGVPVRPCLDGWSERYTAHPLCGLSGKGVGDGLGCSVSWVVVRQTTCIDASCLLYLERLPEYRSRLESAQTILALCDHSRDWG